MGGEVIGWRCKKDLADTKRFAMGAGVVSLFLSLQRLGSRFGGSVAFPSFIATPGQNPSNGGSHEIPSFGPVGLTFSSG